MLSYIIIELHFVTCSVSYSLVCIQVVLTPAKYAMTGAIKKAEELCRQIPNSHSLQQFNNPANPRVHFETTGPEIWRDTCGKVDY